MKLKLRRRRFKTAFLAALVHPTPLLEALLALSAKGDIEWFEYGKYRCTIKLTKHSGLAMILKEATQPVVNPRPKILNKNNGTHTFRKIKS
jgi:hypothetical protein